MQLQHLGRYRLVAPLPVESSAWRMFTARLEDDPDPAAPADITPPSFVVKLMEPGRGGDGPGRRARFDHEVKLLTAANHPCIPTLHASGEQDGVPYMVIDRVDGVDLARLCGHENGATPRAVSKEIAVYVLGQLADAVRHLHELEGDDGKLLDVVHRDLHQKNVVLSKSGDIMLADISTARSRWLAREHDEPNVGALPYQAPERLVGDQIATQQSDLFALAVILWELLRGQRCFTGEPAAVRDAILKFEPAHPSRRIAGLSPKLGEILRKNLDRDPSRRYADAYQMLQRLAQAPEARAAEQSREALAELVASAGPPK
jgi:serine/threonine-protein kinase